MSLTVVLFAYIILTGLFFIYALFNLYHILRFGHFDVASYFMTGLFISGYILIVFITYVFLNGVDWTTTINLFDARTLDVPTTQF